MRFRHAVQIDPHPQCFPHVPFGYRKFSIEVRVQPLTLPQVKDVSQAVVDS
jgi:hypothetical protein